MPRPKVPRQILVLVRAQPWEEVGRKLLETHLELAHGSEQQAAPWAADMIPSIRPQGWEQAPTGEALEAAILAANRPHEGRSQGPTP